MKARLRASLLYKFYWEWLPKSEIVLQLIQNAMHEKSKSFFSYASVSQLNIGISRKNYKQPHVAETLGFKTSIILHSKYNTLLVILLSKVFSHWKWYALWSLMTQRDYDPWSLAKMGCLGTYVRGGIFLRPNDGKSNSFKRAHLLYYLWLNHYWGWLFNVEM